VKIISHRGNIQGENPLLENSKEYVIASIHAGYDVEVDVWNMSGAWFLGHDRPQYEIDEKFLRKPELWCHAKNAIALRLMLERDIHCFWHQEDNYTITSRGYIWAYPGMPLVKNAVCVMPERVNWSQFDKCAGICTDYPNKYRSLINEL
jgi:hypothetical protein